MKMQQKSFPKTQRLQWRTLMTNCSALRLTVFAEGEEPLTEEEEPLMRVNADYTTLILPCVPEPSTVL